MLCRLQLRVSDTEQHWHVCALLCAESAIVAIDSHPSDEVPLQAGPLARRGAAAGYSRTGDSWAFANNAAEICRPLALRIIMGAQGSPPLLCYLLTRPTPRL